MDLGSLLPTVGNFASDYVASQNSIRMPDPNTGKIDDKVNMTPLMYRSTFDKDYRSQNPATAALHQYRHKFQPQVQSSYILGNKFGRPIINSVGRGVQNWLGGGYGKSMGWGAGGGAGLGLLGSLGVNMMGGDTNPLTMSLLGALLGGGLGAAGTKVLNNLDNPSRYQPQPKFVKPEDYQNYFQAQGMPFPQVKSSSYYKSPDDDGRGAQQDAAYILGVVRQSREFDRSEQMRILQAVQQLPSDDLASLKSMLGMVSGAAAGALIVKFLMKKGLLGSMLGALMGGFAGGSMFGSRRSGPTTSLGQNLM